MDRMHFSTAECFENCPARYDFRYNQGIEVLESDDPANPLKVGTALHKGIEEDVQTAIQEYFMSYPVITDAHINEAIKLEHWIPIVKDMLPEGLHEVNIKSDWYEGTMDLLVPCTKHDLELDHGQFDLYDFKYSNNQSHYMESRQLHVYKYFCEKILGKRIRKMFFVFVPKVNIKQKKTETLEDFRRRLMDELQNTDGVQIREVIYDPQKVIEFFEICMKIQYAKEYKKEFSYLCNWCEYNNFCQKGIDYMLLPSSERRQVGQTTKRKLWIYGGAFSGKTTFMDKAPNPLNLNTDGNIQFVTMPYLPIKDTYEGRQKILAWQVFKNAIDELEKKNNDFKTIIVDLLEDSYQSCRLWMYDQMGITHESEDNFRAWDKVRTEYLATIRRLMNLDYENIVLISHEDTSKDITKKGGDKITAIRPNIQEKIANKIAGMVDIVARVVVEDDDSRTLNFKSNEVIFGGGRLKGISKTSIPLDWDALIEVYEEANAGCSDMKKVNHPTNEEKGQEDEQKTSTRGSRRPSKNVEPEQNFEHDETQEEVEPEQEVEQKEEVPEEKPARTRRTRKER